MMLNDRLVISNYYDDLLIDAFVKNGSRTSTLPKMPSMQNTLIIVCLFGPSLFHVPFVVPGLSSLADHRTGVESPGRGRGKPFQQRMAEITSQSCPRGEIPCPALEQPAVLRSICLLKTDELQALAQ